MENKGISLVNKDTFYSTVNDTFPYGVFLYWLDDDLVGEKYENTIPLSHSSSIFSIMYSPFFTKEDFILHKILYDKDRFIFKDKVNIGLPLDTYPYVYRINRFNSIVDVNRAGVQTKNIGRITCYKKPKRTVERSWRNETKLYNYPYTYGYITDGICDPFEVRYHLCDYSETDYTTNLWVRCALNINSDYGYFFRNYKGDNTAIMEDHFVTKNKELPTSSNQYAQWMATNKNQLQAQSLNIVTNALAGGLTSMVLSGGNPLVGLGGAVLSAGGSLLTNNISKTAQERDMRNLPNSLTSAGGELIYGINKTGKTVKHVKYRQSDAYMQKLGDYFAMFGYKQNKIIDLENEPPYSKRSRHYYNYIKTVGVNIQSQGIPKEHLQELKVIYDKGVTIWHMDREGVTVGDYSKDNYEV